MPALKRIGGRAPSPKDGSAVVDVLVDGTSKVASDSAEDVSLVAPSHGERVPWQDVFEHVKQNNPHGGTCRDALSGMEHPNRFDWTSPIEIQPNDPRISTNSLDPASQRDVARYMKAYQDGSDFPAIVLTPLKSGTFVVQDGAHRLQAAINLGVPVLAFIGTKRDAPTWIGR